MTVEDPAGPVRWRGRIRLRGVNPYVLVEATLAQRLAQGRRGPVPLRVQVNGHPDPPWRVHMVPVGDGSFYLYLNGVVREASGTAVGDHVEVSAAFDAEYRGGPAHPIPDGFARGLARNGPARATWEQLPPSRQKEIVRYLSNLKSEPARDRNIARALAVLGGATARFLGRTWNPPPTSTAARSSSRARHRRREN